MKEETKMEVKEARMEIENGEERVGTVTEEACAVGERGERESFNKNGTVQSKQQPLMNDETTKGGEQSKNGGRKRQRNVRNSDEGGTRAGRKKKK